MLSVKYSVGVSQAMIKDQCVGTIVCKLAEHKSGPYRGYIAMLAVDTSFRKKKIGIVGRTQY